MLGSRILTFMIAALVAAGSFAQVPSSPIPAPMSAQPVAIASDAPVGPRDILAIGVFQDPNFNSTVTVTEEGTVTLNPLGKVPVSGLTLTQIEQRLKSLLEARFLNKADVTVDLIEAGSKPIS